MIDQIQYLIDEIHDFGFDTGIGMYTADGDDINSEAKKTMCWHYVAITGVYLNDHTGKVYLKVQSWGRVYYLDYDEFLEYCSGLGREGRLLFID